MGAKKKEERGDPPFERGDRVVVQEPGITHRAGTVGAVKWSFVSGWFVEVRYDLDGLTRAIPARHVVPEPREGLVHGSLWEVGR